MDYMNPMAMADLESERMKLGRNEQLLSALMGGHYVKDSGNAGLATSIIGSLIGAFQQKRQDENLKDWMTRSFEAENQQATAKRQQELADEERKFQKEIEKASRINRDKAKADKEFAKSEFTGGGVFDPSTGSFSPSQEWMNQQLGLKAGEARISAANRAPAADPFAKYKLAVQQGILTPEQAQQAIQRDLMGAGGQNAPSGYRPTADGALEPIPGGPADPAAQAAKPRVLPADMAGRVALAEEYLSNAPNIMQEVEGGSLTGLVDAPAAKAGYGKSGEVFRQIQSGRDALQRTLTGAGMPATEADEYANRYLPQVTDTAEKLASKQKQLQAELSRFVTEARGAPPATGSGAQVGKIITAPDGKRYRITGGDPSDPDVEPVQ